MLDYLIISIITKAFIKDKIRRAYKFSVILGIIMVGHLFLYTIGILLLKKYSAPWVTDMGSSVDILRYILLGVAIGEFFFIRFIRKMGIRRLHKGDPSRKEILERLIDMSFFIFASCESVAFFGLVLFFLTRKALDFYIFLILSLFYLGIYWPKYSQWEKCEKYQEVFPEVSPELRTSPGRKPDKYDKRAEDRLKQWKEEKEIPKKEEAID